MPKIRKCALPCLASKNRSKPCSATCFVQKTRKPNERGHQFTRELEKLVGEFIDAIGVNVLQCIVGDPRSSVLPPPGYAYMGLCTARLRSPIRRLASRKIAGHRRTQRTPRRIPSPEFRRHRPSVESALIVPFSARAAMLLHPEGKRQQSDVPDRSRTRRPDPSSRQQQQEPAMTRGLFNDCGVPSSRQALQFCPHLPTCLDDFASRLADARK